MHSHSLLQSLPSGAFKKKKSVKGNVSVWSFGLVNTGSAMLNLNDFHFDQVKTFIFKMKFENYALIMAKSKMSYTLKKVTNQLKEQAHFR